MALIREPDGIDFVIEPHVVSEDEHLAMLAFIAACKERRAVQEEKVNKMKRHFRHIAAAVI